MVVIPHLKEALMPGQRDDSAQDARATSILTRRIFLRGSLVAGALAGAGGLSACKGPGMGIGPASPPAGAAGSEPQNRNVPKAVALYQNVPNGQQRCGACTHFRPPNGCEIVAGRVSEEGWCKFYKAFV